MNITVQTCGLVVLLILFYFYMIQKRMMLRTGIAFRKLFIGVIVATMADIASVFAIGYAHRLPEIVVFISCKLYLVLILYVAFSALRYVLADAYGGKRVYDKSIRAYTAVLLLTSVIVIFLPIRYVFEEEGAVVYTEGAAVMVTYTVACILILNIFYHLRTKRASMNIKRRNSVIVWLLLWISMATLQFFTKFLLITSFAGVLGVLIVYLMFENPQTFIDRRTGLYNQNALVQYVKELYGKNESFSLIYIALEKMNFSGKKEKKGNDSAFIDYLENNDGVVAFCRFAKEIIIIAENSEELDRIKQDIDDRFYSEWKKKGNKYANANWYFLRDTGFTTDANTLIYFLEYVKHHNTDVDSDGIINIDRTLFEKMVEDKKVEELIDEALKYDRIEVYYQPIYSTSSGRFMSAEALARIKDEEGKIIPPGVFINVAEENGMIIKLGEKVFEKVCKFIKSDEFPKLNIDYIEINLSVVQCSHKHLAEEFINIMNRYDVSPQYINLEITESASIHGKGILKDNMKELIEFGVSFSLDDFGTGHSNLNYIAEMPVDIVKFDRGMITSYFTDEKVKYVMDAAMGMIKGMRLKIVSEGIETKEQFDTMNEIGIHYIQGFYFSKPLPEAEFVRFIKDNIKG